VFHQEGQAYDLSVTDPVIRSLLAQKEDGTYDADLDGGIGSKRMFLTLSLAGPLDNGNCYKLVAAAVPIL